MQIHPAIAALRSDQEMQSSTQEQFLKTLAEWHESANTQSVRQDLDAFGKGQDLSECPLLDRLVCDHVAASAFVQKWQRTMIAALRQYPLADLTFKHRAAPGLVHMALLASGNASLSVIAYEERGEFQLPRSAVFSDRETYECVLSGSADGMMHEVRQCDGLDTIIDTCTAHWRKGAVIETKGSCKTRQVVAVNGAMVILQLSRVAAEPKPTREYSLYNGDLVKTISGDKIASQKVMALSVLGAMDAHSALDAMRQSALTPYEDLDVRWEAVRQTLALDAARGIDLLDTIAELERDPLCLPARDLRLALMENQPELSHLFGAVA